MMTYITIKHQEKMYIIPTTSNPNYYAQSIGEPSASLLNFNTTEKLPPMGK